MDCYEQPYADSSGLATMALCEAVKGHVSVALSGDGGDEFFGGYDRYVWYGKALKALQNVLKDDPENPSVLYHIGVCYNRMDEPFKAIPPLKRVTELTPEDGRAYYFLGVVYDKQGQTDEAKKHYRTADSLFHKSGPQRAVS